ncbi:arginine deiminase family protein [Roseomonas sp. OT10]|uniref:dimethylarginine dimethylaminohydrolase family protein n=1 Tax=Roseomonas cutis TaxID=2897332 RepID=UPI001E2FC142|nr:arginine deiminase family protein [Roseomonas sp. OT10]UFN48307.1 arginine deiminase family protein [Roseomonas sp. OT10]
MARAMSEFDHRYNMLIERFASEAEPAFTAESEQVSGWGRRWGCADDVGRLRVVLMHRPGEEMAVVETLPRIPELNAYGDPESGAYWRGTEIPTLAEQQAQHDALAEALRDEGVEVVYLRRAAKGRHKTVYTRDSCIAVDGGAVVTRMGPRIRRGEEQPVTETLAALGMPILRTIHGTGLLEGGSFAYLRPDVAVVGVSSRVNEEGARQLEEVLAVQGTRLIRVQIPGYRLHIDGALVMLSHDVALVNPVILPFTFMEEMKRLGIRMIPLNHEDPSWAINCLAVAPGRVLMSDKVGPRTQEALDRAGISVRLVAYDRVYLGGGGIHCSTSPLVRDRG